MMVLSAALPVDLLMLAILRSVRNELGVMQALSARYSIRSNGIVQLVRL